VDVVVGEVDIVRETDGALEALILVEGVLESV
jgi:hypothetical protein